LHYVAVTIIQICTASNSKGGCRHNRWGVTAVEALLIANYTLISMAWRTEQL